MNTEDTPNASARRIRVSKQWLDDNLAWFFYWLPIGMVFFIIALQILKLLIRLAQ